MRSKPESQKLKISIITPSFNQGQYIEETINSVLRQNYSNIEHIIVDGGSTDETLDNLKKYNHLKWISENDSGQSDAINKGFAMATGDVIAWINSDDYYEENVFGEIMDCFSTNRKCNFLYGDITYVDKDGVRQSEICGDNIHYENLLRNPDLVRQPSSFWRRCVVEKIGLLNEKYHLTMDLDYFIRISKNYKFHYIKKNLSYFRQYESGKTSKYKRRQLLEILCILIRERKLMVVASWKYILKKTCLLFL